MRSLLLESARSVIKLDRRNVPILIAGITNVTKKMINNSRNSDPCCMGESNDDAKNIINKKRYVGINRGWNAMDMYFANRSLTTALFLIWQPVYLVVPCIWQRFGGQYCILQLLIVFSKKKLCMSFRHRSLFQHTFEISRNDK